MHPATLRHRAQLILQFPCPWERNLAKSHGPFCDFRRLTNWLGRSWERIASQSKRLLLPKSDSGRTKHPLSLYLSQIPSPPSSPEEDIIIAIPGQEIRWIFAALIFLGRCSHSWFQHPRHTEKRLWHAGSQSRDSVMCSHLWVQLMICRSHCHQN